MVERPRKKDLGGFVKAPIDTRHKVISDGFVASRHRPVQINVRLTGQQVEWLQNRVEGNMTYVFMKIMDKAIAELNERLVDGDFNIDDY